jgi:hypothetical protein
MNKQRSFYAGLLVFLLGLLGVTSVAMQLLATPRRPRRST